MRKERSLVASVLDADMGALRQACLDLEQAGIDGIQWDVMDGRFVPNLTLGPSIVAACRDAVTIPFEAHLMIADPDPYIGDYVDAGCGCVIVHSEACTHLHRTLGAIRAAGARAGAAINPATPVSSIIHVLDQCDLVLVMTVSPGFGGQSYIPSMETKIVELRTAIDRSGRGVDLEVDGGIGEVTIVGAASAGADRFVVGSALYRADSPVQMISMLRNEIETSVERLGA